MKQTERTLWKTLDKLAQFNSPSQFLDQLHSQFMKTHIESLQVQALKKLFTSSSQVQIILIFCSEQFLTELLAFANAFVPGMLLLLQQKNVVNPQSIILEVIQNAETSEFSKVSANYCNLASQLNLLLFKCIISIEKVWLQSQLLHNKIQKKLYAKFQIQLYKQLSKLQLYLELDNEIQFDSFVINTIIPAYARRSVLVMKTIAEFDGLSKTAYEEVLKNQSVTKDAGTQTNDQCDKQRVIQKVILNKRSKQLIENSSKKEDEVSSLGQNLTIKVDMVSQQIKIQKIKLKQDQEPKQKQLDQFFSLTSTKPAQIRSKGKVVKASLKKFLTKRPRPIGKPAPIINLGRRVNAATDQVVSLFNRRSKDQQNLPDQKGSCSNVSQESVDGSQTIKSTQGSTKQIKTLSDFPKVCSDLSILGLK